jgi:hypothetical protein
MKYGCPFLSISTVSHGKKDVPETKIVNTLSEVHLLY